MAPRGRKLLRVEARNAQIPIKSKPDWLHTCAIVSDIYWEVRDLVREKSLHTMCTEVNCPSIYECQNDRGATFPVGGEICTQRCDFYDTATDRPTEYGVDESRRVAVPIKEMDLRYATVTGMVHDDRLDGGAWFYAGTAHQVRKLLPDTNIELFTPDSKGNPDALEDIFSSCPEVLGHNLETVLRIFKRIRPAFSCQGGLDVITAITEAEPVARSNLILGMGETRDEIEAAMATLVEARCDILTVIRYLHPSKLHHPINRWVKSQEFVDLSRLAEEARFAAVMGNPMMRSSYRVGMLRGRVMVGRGRPIPEHLSQLTEPAIAHQEALVLPGAYPYLAAACRRRGVGPTQPTGFPVRIGLPR